MKITKSNIMTKNIWGHYVWQNTALACVTITTIKIDLHKNELLQKLLLVEGLVHQTLLAPLVSQLWALIFPSRGGNQPHGSTALWPAPVSMLCLPPPD